MHDGTPEFARVAQLAAQDVDKLLISSDKIAKRGGRIEQLDLPEPQRPVVGKDRPRLVAEN